MLNVPTCNAKIKLKYIVKAYMKMFHSNLYLNVLVACRHCAYIFIFHTNVHLNHVMISTLGSKVTSCIALTRYSGAKQ